MKSPHEKLNNILNDIYDNGIKSRHIKRYNLSLSDIRMIEKIRADCRNGLVVHTIRKNVADMLKQLGYIVQENGIGWEIGLK